MTLEEAIKHCTEIVDECMKECDKVPECHHDTYAPYVRTKAKTEEYAHYVEWLEELQYYHKINDLPPVNPQEPKTDVLDKIRAEVESIDTVKELDDNSYIVIIKSPQMIKDEVLEIIDKYRESEVNNDSISFG